MTRLLKFFLILLACACVKSSERCSNLKKKSSCLVSDRCLWEQLQQQCKPVDYRPHIQLCEVCQAPTTTTHTTTTSEFIFHPVCPPTSSYITLCSEYWWWLFIVYLMNKYSLTLNTSAGSNDDHHYPAGSNDDHHW